MDDATTQRWRAGSNYLVFLKALIKSFQNQVSLLDLEQVVRNAVDIGKVQLIGGSSVYFGSEFSDHLW